MKADSNVEVIPKECLLSYIKMESIFSYTIIERHKQGLNDDSYWSSLDIDSLSSIFHILKLRIENSTLLQQLDNETKIKNYVLNNEKMPICIIDKHTQEILEYNNYYKEVLPSIVQCKYYYKLIEKESDFLIENYLYIYLGGKHWIKKILPIVLNNGKEAYIIYAKDTQEHINQLQSIDNLTLGLSLVGLKEYYEKTVKYDDSQYMLLTLDIHKFKNINKKYGYEIGSNLLKEISCTIQNILRDDEAYCRLNDDKFAILFKESEPERLNNRYVELQDKLREIQIGIILFNNLIIFAGVCEVTKDLDFNSIIDRAVMAKRIAKTKGLNSIYFYDTEIENLLQREYFIEDKVSDAKNNDEFKLFLQPKFDINTMQLCGAEALTRWVTLNDMIYPNEFVPLFETSGFIITLDFIIYEKVFKFIRYCLDNKMPVYPVSMNVSRNHINTNDFIDRFMTLVNNYEIPLELIELEITESAFIENEDTLIEFIHDLKSHHLKISIDDFGTAYSSLHMLTTIDIDIIKIDKSFLHNLGKGSFEKNKQLLKNIINLAKDLDFKIVCEGVETDEQVEVLRGMDCEIGQGYIFSKPLEVEQYVKNYLV